MAIHHRISMSSLALVKVREQPLRELKRVSRWKYYSYDYGLCMVRIST